MSRSTKWSIVSWEDSLTQSSSQEEPWAFTKAEIHSHCPKQLRLGFRLRQHLVLLELKGSQLSNFSIHQNHLAGLLKHIKGPHLSFWFRESGLKPKSIHFFFFNCIYLFLERGEGRKKEREGEREGQKHPCVVASHVAPTGDLAHYPDMCPDWESNQQPFGLQPTLNPLSYTSQGQKHTFLTSSQMLLPLVPTVRIFL